MYSVMNTRSRQYDYYETGEAEPWHAGRPPTPSAASSLGAVPEEAAWRLPSSAKYTGSGDTAKGHVASSSRGLGLGDILPSGIDGTMVGIVGAGIALYALSRKRRTR
jgi:hypothetical protein